MSKAKILKLKKIKNFNDLIEYLRDELDWPIEVEDAEDITFDYNPKELGIEGKYTVKINAIKQIRPFVDNQPWGLFYIEFESKNLPVVVLRRILSALIHNRRNASNRMKTWDLSDLIFISTLGEKIERKISFAHFSESEQGLPVLRTFSWDPTDTYFHYLQTKLDLEKLRWPEDEKKIERWREKWSSAFILKHREVVRTSKQLATLMAQLAAQIREQVKLVYSFEIETGPLHKLLDNFKQTLIRDLKIDNFADMYAQTIAYGLFSARVSYEGKFALDDISAMIPNTNPFLKKFFKECTRIGENSLDSLDLEELGVKELIFLLKESNIEAILRDFGRQKKGEDPVIHFYELFLKEFDPKQKIQRGVFYTPDPVVSFIVRSVDEIIKEEFKYNHGLADISPYKNFNDEKNQKKQNYEIQILDPCVGTGTFLKHVIKQIKHNFDEMYKDIKEEKMNLKWNKYVYNHLLSKIYGFELMMAPYSVAHLKLGLTLMETGYKFESDKRLGIYLTNSLGDPFQETDSLDKFLKWLADENQAANEIKINTPTPIIIGNPPYNPKSENKSQFINQLMNDYYDAVKFEQKKSGLDEDYIKFFRFAHWKIDQGEQGLLAFITNYSYLKGLIQRGMRDQLMQSFNKIYILNLHGGSKPPEPIPEGISSNENVFDIQVGVAIGIFIKRMDLEKKDTCVKIYDLWGNREDKFDFLNKNSVKTIKWNSLYTTYPPIHRNYFLKLDFKEDLYNKGLGINLIFNKFKVGIQVGKAEKDLSEENQIFNLKKISADFSEYFYRPFSLCYIHFSTDKLHRARGDFFPGILNSDNYESIVVTRQSRKKIKSWKHFFVCNGLVDRCYTDFDNNFIFPFKFNNIQNIRTEVIDFLSSKYESKIQAVDLFNYVIGLFSSGYYRNNFKDILMKDFANIIFPDSLSIFKKVSKFGKRIKLAQLLKIQGKEDIFNYPSGEFDKKIEKIEYNEKNHLLHLNKDFSINLTPNEYNFYVGSRSPVKDWFEFRKNTNIELNEEALKLISTIIASVDEIIKVEDQLNQYFDSIQFTPLECNICYETIIKNLTQKNLIQIYKKNKKKPVKLEEIIKSISRTYSESPSEFEHISMSYLELIANKVSGASIEAKYAPKFDGLKDFL